LKLGRAYETLKDETKRRDYDLIYPSIRQSTPFAQNTQTPRPSYTSPPQSEALKEAAQIDALQKLKQERGARWRTKKSAFDSSIYELQRIIRQLEIVIKGLDSIAAGEAAEEALKNSWGTWLLSPLYKKPEDSEEVKARKDREKTERRIEKDMKERRLEVKKAELKKEESLYTKAKEEVDAADAVDDRKILVIQMRIRARETKEREDRENAERERVAKIRKQQQEQREKQFREAAEAARKQQAEAAEAAEALRKQQAAARKLQWEAAKKRQAEAAEAWEKQQAEEQKRREEQARERQKIIDDARKSKKQHADINLPKASARQAQASTCRHDGWWPKVQGRKACPECKAVWLYLLQCPGCSMKACPQCQSAIRPRRPRNAARTAPPRARSPSPDLTYEGYGGRW
jgi:hypothetical protein